MTDIAVIHGKETHIVSPDTTIALSDRAVLSVHHLKNGPYDKGAVFVGLFQDNGENRTILKETSRNFFLLEQGEEKSIPDISGKNPFEIYHCGMCVI